MFFERAQKDQECSTVDKLWNTQGGCDTHMGFVLACYRENAAIPGPWRRFSVEIAITDHWPKYSERIRIEKFTEPKPKRGKAVWHWNTTQTPQYNPQCLFRIAVKQEKKPDNDFYEIENRESTHNGNKHCGQQGGLHSNAVQHSFARLAKRTTTTTFMLLFHKYYLISPK